ncbi:DUF1993 family protein [Alginatibacterium sediminis]|uniref:DUF1993 family protein n=1 Tax=Alginatibacterium sediminis TaxID=2164068 RepID=A0A420E784_9ALTE|nr:DUF1993 family protein [Alginatibacterium sediminis]RKF14278.1 DUF1993 family protein [Alginatibacterium sediminis]
MLQGLNCPIPNLRTGYLLNMLNQGLAQQPQLLFIHYLNQLEHMLSRIEASDDNNQSFLGISLQPQMFDLRTQLHICVNFSLRACCPLWQRITPNFEAKQPSYEALFQEIIATRDYLKNLGELPTGAWEQQLSEKAGFAELDLPAFEFVYQYAFPNFMFHYTMVYTIAKSCCVELGKADFDGYHQYPQDFSFIDE